VWVLVSFSLDLFIFQYYLSLCSILYPVVLKYKNWEKKYFCTWKQLVKYTLAERAMAFFNIWLHWEIRRT